MNRPFYQLAIFFHGLYAAAALFQGVMLIQLGYRAFRLQSFAGWFVFVALVSLVMSLIQLKYFHFKKYQLTFSAMMLLTAASCWSCFIVYSVVVEQKLQEYYIPVYLLTLAMGMLFGVSLVFSTAGKRSWLRMAGIFFFIFNLALITIVIIAISYAGLKQVATLEKINQWLSLAASLIPILFIVNFVQELRAMKEEDAPWKLREASLASLGLVAVIGALFFGSRFARESFVVPCCPEEITAEARRLAEPFEAARYVNNHGDTLVYRFMKPLNYDPQKKYPLAVCLHHGGAHGTDNIRQIEGSQPAQLLASATNREKYPAFIFVPQCPQGTSWGGIPNYPTIDSLTFEAIGAFEKEFSIDETRRYVMGISGGGYGSWHFICTHPRMFAAAIPICGGADLSLARNIVDVPVWAFHGEDDRSVPVRYSRDMIEAIKKAGGDPRYTEFPGEGHNIWHKVSAIPSLEEWLFAQQRDSLVVGRR